MSAGKGGALQKTTGEIDLAAELAQFRGKGFVGRDRKERRNGVNVRSSSWGCHFH